ncbi:hypothetical protein [Niveispirillum irakense]|uniref:hypothetical protein n=1 Tax=Niveispirillum irakense TaxID=34011 RepID=UPI00041CED50|nr:hypothetical protein [Niveispirillum irakense]
MGYVGIFLTAGVIGVAAYIFAYLVARLMESSVQSRPELRQAEEVLPRRSLLEAKFDNRRSERKARLTQLQSEIAELRRRRFIQDKLLADAKREAQAPVRVIGAEGRALLRFRAWMVNRQVQAAAAERKHHPLLDTEWASPQIVEVWADNLTDAKRELQRFFPMPLGFAVLNINIALSPELVAADAAANG